MLRAPANGLPLEGTPAQRPPGLRAALHYPGGGRFGTCRGRIPCLLMGVTVGGESGEVERGIQQNPHLLEGLAEGRSLVLRDVLRP